MRTGVLCGKKFFLARKVGYYQPVAYFQRGFQAVAEARVYSVFKHYSVDDDANTMFNLLVEIEFFFQVVNFAVYFYSGISGFTERLYFLFILAFSASCDGRFYYYLGSVAS